MSQRTYSEKEIAEIIRRAAEMESVQLREKNPSGDLPGLNLDELSEVAAEAGLDPENVRQAAHQLDHPTSNRESSTTKNEVFAERWIDGKLTDEIIDLVISDLNHRYSASHKRKSWRENILDNGGEDEIGKSTVQRTGKSLEWRFTDDYEGVETRVLIQPRKEQVRIRVSKKGAWGLNLDDYFEDEAIEYLAYVPYLAGLIVLFSLPYNFLVNLSAAIVAFTLLQLTLVPGAKKLSERIKGPGSSGPEKRIDKLKQEVEKVADDLGLLIGGSSMDQEAKGQIEIPDESEAGQRDKDNEADGRKRSGLK